MKPNIKMLKEKSPPLETSTPLGIVGRFKPNQELGRYATAYFVEKRSTSSFPHEVPHTQELDMQLDSMNSAVLALGRDAGVDLTDNLPPASAHHFFQSRQDFKDDLSSVGVVLRDGQEGSCNDYGVSAVIHEDLFYTLNMMSHERFHFLDKTRTSLTQHNDGSYAFKPYRTGYAKGDSFNGLTEMFTDLRNVHLMKGGYWDAQPNLPKRRDIYGYTSWDILGDELIKDSAQKQGVAPLELLRAIEKDMFMGESNGLRQLMAPYSTQAKRLLVELPSTDLGLVQKTAAELGLTEAVAKIDAVKRTGDAPADILGWIAPAKKS